MSAWGYGEGSGSARGQGVPAQVHYLGDPGRGSVWEETIINCPPHIQLLAMSATIANADDLGGWISQAPPPPRALSNALCCCKSSHTASPHAYLMSRMYTHAIRMVQSAGSDPVMLESVSVLVAISTH